MKEQTLTFLLNHRVSEDCFVAEFEYSGDPELIFPGQFLNLRLPDPSSLIPRPFSVFEVGPSSLSILYKVVGKGTELISQSKKGDAWKSFLPLGNTFPSVKPEGLVLLSGGVGIAPLYFYLKHLKDHSPSPNKKMEKITLYAGFATSITGYLKESLESLGCELIFCTDDGSLGVQGFSLQALQNDLQNNPRPLQTLFGCGPHKMLEALAHFGIAKDIPTFLSLEEVMGCGFGACMGCAVPKKTLDGTRPYQLACVDGPIFDAKTLSF